MKNLKFFSYFLITIILALGLSISFQSLLAAWTAPADLPPTCASGNPGCDAPINGSLTTQQKSGTLILNTAGNTNGLIVQSGNVGIGTISPSTKLQISGAVDINGQLTTAILGNAYNYWTTFGGATGGRIRGESTEGYLVLDGNPSGSNPRVLINHNSSGNVIIANGGGNVGIGMTSPSAKLHIQGVESESSGTLEALVRFNTSNGLVGQLYRDNNGTNNYLGMESFNVGNTVKTPIVFQEWGGNVGIGTNNPSKALEVKGDIKLGGATAWSQISNNGGSNNGPWIELVGKDYAADSARRGEFNLGSYGTGNIKFFNFTGSGWLELMTITPVGNVGVGAINPQTNLHIQDNVSPVGTHKPTVLIEGRTGAVGGGNTPRLGMVDLAVWPYTISGSPAWMIDNQQDRFRIFRQQNIATPGSEYLTIINGGNVGIGTTNPGYKLHVNGSFAATSKNFDIIDPRYNNLNRRLIHATIEGPEHAVFYRGEAKLKNGYIEIILPDYFEALTGKENRSILLTNIDGFDRIAVKLQNGQSVKDGRFIVYSDNNKSEQNFYWEVKAVRSDIPALETEITR